MNSMVLLSSSSFLPVCFFSFFFFFITFWNIEDTGFGECIVKKTIYLIIPWYLS